MENVSVTVNILERSYKLSIAAQEEKYLRDAAALIDAQARMFKKQFGHRDNQDFAGTGYGTYQNTGKSEI